MNIRYRPLLARIHCQNGTTSLSNESLSGKHNWQHVDLLFLFLVTMSQYYGCMTTSHYGYYT